MTLKSKDIDWLARLARIELSPQENAAALEQINQFFFLVEKMRAVDTSGVTPLSHPLTVRGPLAQRLRVDQVTEKTDLATRQDYQKCAIETEDGFYLVPRVVE